MPERGLKPSGDRTGEMIRSMLALVNEVVNDRTECITALNARGD